MKTIKAVARAALGAALLAHLTACGTLIHPERKGQRDGRIDPGIAVLDGIGLLFFIIPGVIAFAVDFTNGTIYLPGSRGHRSSLDPADAKLVRFDPARATLGDIEAAVERETGLAIRSRGLLVSRRAPVSE